MKKLYKFLKKKYFIRKIFREDIEKHIKDIENDMNASIKYETPKNKSKKSRHAYSLHIIDGNSVYPKENWLQRSSLPLKGFI